MKTNPQTKNRVDIYMTVAEARLLGQALIAEANTQTWQEPRRSSARPQDARAGRMELPTIVWSRYLRPLLSAAKSESGILMKSKDSFVNIDFETKHETHIKMGDREIHIGISLNPPQGWHDSNKTTLVDVDPSELQRPVGRAPERNPVPKVEGAVLLLLCPADAAGLGRLLTTFDENEM
ncbi:hypothetical protein BN961_00322 [Afipia felis]|uniref:Uncharacterized protein n=1 Tax=Afipia felis TaxID=1035 RepID=A0A090MH87_AFIFE|nr:hypothetical protein BN961_00322 [Afipia felis]